MFKHFCCCGAVSVELNTDTLCDTEDLDVATLTESGSSALGIRVDCNELVVNAPVELLSEIEVTPGRYEYCCNLCASTLFLKDITGECHIVVNYTGHDTFAQLHNGVHKAP